MQVAVFGTKAYDRACLQAANVTHGHALTFFEPRLTRHTSTLAAGFPAICVFVNEQSGILASTSMRKKPSCFSRIYRCR